MKGYWHIVAISVGMSGLSIIFDNYLFLLIFFLWLFYLFYNERLNKNTLIVSLILSLFFNLYIPSKSFPKQTSTLADQQQFTGKIVTPVSISHQKLEFILKNKDNDKLLVLYFFNEHAINVHELTANLKYGGTCKVIGKIEIPNESRNPGQFNYRDYLLSKGISHQMIISSLDEIECMGSSPLHKVYLLRDWLISSVTLQLSSETGGWLNALIFGDDSNINDQTIDLFQRWGLSHLLAISGLHVGLVISLVYFILIKLNVLTKEKAQWIMIFFLPIYALLAGGEPSVWRASGMVLLFIILNKINLKLSITDTLSIIFLILLFVDKYMIYHIGFQFSFIVTLGLILSRQMISQTKSKFFKVLKISFISQMMILPLQMNYFFIFQPLSILVNTFVVPYFSFFVIPYMFLLIILLPLPSFMIEIFDILFSEINDLMLYLLQWIDDFLNYPFIFGDFPIFFSCIYYILFFVMMKNLEKKRLIKSLKYGCLMSVLIICLYLRPYFSPVGTVTMLDIGQGDAFIIELPFRRGVFMVDAGSQISFSDFNSTDKVYQQIIKPYLYSRGIQHIDTIFISHKDIDHMGSVQYIIEDFNVHQIVVSKYYHLDQEEILLFNRNNIHIERVEANETLQIKEQLFFVLSPMNDNKSKNDNSLVLYSKIGGKAWLFTGDIGKDVERKISRQFEKLSVDILKVAHHGSNTSTDPEFLGVINPTHAFISVGTNNFFGHPSKEVIETLETKGITIFRTDEDGAVQYRYQKNKGTFWKYLP